MSKKPHQASSEGSLESLLLRFRDHGDTAALTELFDKAAPGLRRLARRLTGPRRHDLADDALQETFLALVEKPERFDDSRRLLPWLASVLVNRLRSLQERESRNLDESRLTAREVASPEDAALYNELAARVESEVGKLPSTVREAVEGKVLRGEEIEDLSRELGISSGAFRVRLHRGLNKLRAALPKSLLGGLGALGLRDRSYAAIRVRVLTAGGASSGTTVVSAWAVIGFALFCTIGTILWLLQPDRESEDRNLAAGQIEAELEASPEIEASPQLTNPEPDSSRALSQRRASRRSATLRVILVDIEDGSQKEGVKVHLVYSSAEDLASLAGTTDEFGAFDFDVEPFREVSRIYVGCGEVTTATTLYVGGELRPDELREETLQVGRGGTLSGRVVDTSGNAVPGALVRAWCGTAPRGSAARSVVADEAGRYRIEHLGPDFVMRASAEGFASHTGFHGFLDDGEDLRDKDLVLAPVVTLRGRVVDESGEPVPQAKAHMTGGLNTVVGRQVRSFPDAEGESVTDDAGSFEIAGLPDANRRVCIEHPGFERFYAQVEAPFSKEKRFVLERALMVKGLVLDAAGRPASGARIRGWPRNEAAFRANWWVIADEDGRFSMEGFNRPEPGYNAPPGVVIRHEGHALQVFDSVEPLVQPTDDVVFRLTERSKVISGTVKDASGDLARGVEVRVVGTRMCETGVTWAGKPSTWEFAADLSEGRTNEQGEFRFDQLYPGTFEARVFDPRDRQRWTTERVVAGTEGVEIVLSEDLFKKVVLVGKVRGAVDGEALTKFSIRPMRQIDEDKSEGHTYEFFEETGEFRIEGLEPGRYEISASALGRATLKRPLTFLAEGEHKILFELSPARTLHLKLEVESDHGEPFRVNGFDSSGQKLMFPTGLGSTSSHVSFQEGKAFLQGLPASRVFLTVASPRRSEELEIDLTESRDEPLIVRFDALPMIPVSYLAIEIRSENVRSEMMKHWRAGDSPERTAWWKKNFEQIGPARDDVVFEFLDESGEVLARDSYEPNEEGTLTMEGENFYPDWGGRSSVGLEMPHGFFVAPSDVLKVRVTSRTYANEEYVLEGNEEEWKNGEGALILLRRP